MSGRPLDWLVGKWQWPYAALFTAGFLGLLAPLVFRYAGIPLGLVYLQLPIYMLHQYEEHAGDRFRAWVNNMLGQGMLGRGHDVLTPIATFWINSLMVWGLDLVALYLACFVDLSLGLIAIYLPMLNAVGHIVPAIIKRKYNPGLLTSIFLFLPIGVLSTYVVSRAAGCDLKDHLLALGVAIAVHGTIIAHVRRRIAYLTRTEVHALAS
ncbi:MAG: HXXEE domain-containing protein [Planctomycetia bacterium]|nr:HXXEE domain-containing protein [Planctomycetia bacterium]